MEIQGSIANELYSGILQSSIVELDKYSVATETDHNLQVAESASVDLWGDEGSSCDNSLDTEWQKRRNQFHTIGYRDGIMAGKEAVAQEGFNNGFSVLANVGYNWGLVRGITSAMACLPDGLKEKLVETKEMRKEFQCLNESVQSISTTDALKLFHEDQKRKSTNQNESFKPDSASTDLNRQRTDMSVLENHYRKLQSIISDSPRINAHLDINQ